MVVPEHGTMAKHFANATLHVVPEFVERIQRSPWKWTHRCPWVWVHILLNLFGLTIAAIKIVRLIRQLQPDIVYANHMLANPVALAVGMWTKTDVYFHQRNIHEAPISRMFYRWMASRSIVKKVIGTSYSAIELFKDSSPEKTVVVYNSLRDEKIDSAQPNRDPHTMVFGYVGRILPKKGVDIFLRALFEVLPEFPHARGLLVGGNDGGLHIDLLGQYQRQVAKQGLSDRIKFVGYQEDIMPHVAKMDVLVAPSQQPESFGRIFIEAMPYGVPSITTNIGGAREVVQGGVNGWWIPVKKVDRFVEIMRHCLIHPEAVKAKGAQGQKVVSEVFRSSIQSKKLDQLILHGFIQQEKSMHPFEQAAQAIVLANPTK